MKIRAKMQCTHVNSIEECETVYLSAVIDGSEENKSFAELTPSASVEICITNKSARDSFVEGKEYYIDFSEA